MVDAAQVTEHLEVLSSDGQHVGRVDHVRGDEIELARLDRTTQGKHYMIPLSWVDHVDDRVHLNVSSEQAGAGWHEKPD